ncbi:MAG TPA: ATP-binding protein [Solirubrobacteraceae bacterium]|nr:ATP-binding protein [Solirubrobacteraceae bacterium]
MKWSGGEVAKLLSRAEQARRDAEALCTAAPTARPVPADGLSRQPIVRRRYDAAPEAIPLARAAVLRIAAVAGMSGRQLDSVRLALSEAVSQAVMRAGCKTQRHIHLTATVARGELVVLIADEGLGPREPLGDDWAQQALAGIADEFTAWQRSSGGMEVEIRWRIDSVDAGTPALRPAATGRAGAVPATRR